MCVCLRFRPLMIAALVLVFCGASLACGGQDIEMTQENQQNQNNDTTDNDNSGETDCEDECGGPDCPPCEVGEECEIDSDCESDRCTAGTCAADPSEGDGCEDLVCGFEETCYRGDCYPECEGEADCDPEERCFDESHCAPTDCEGVACLEGEVCHRGGCYDQCAHDGECGPGESCEEDACIDTCEEVDCPGGEDCYRGQCFEACSTTTDCSGGRCHEDVCLPQDCAAVDCPNHETCIGGICHPGCSDDSDCEGEATCENDACIVGSCEDGLQSGEQTDVDCGGPNCPPCEVGQSCQEPSDCVNEVCIVDTCGETRLPSVRTRNPTDITDQSVVLEGRFSDLGRPEPTAHGLCVDTASDPSVGSANCEDLGAPESDDDFSVEFTTLDQGQVYYARAFATNDEGTDYGDNVEFALLPSTPTGLSADNSEPGDVELTWDAVDGATEYHVVRDGDVIATTEDPTYTDGDGPAPTVEAGSITATEGDFSTHVALTHSGASAEPGDDADYQVRAVNPGGESDLSNSVTSFRDVGAIGIRYQRTDADDPTATYSAISGHLDPGEEYDDDDAPEDGSGRYYRAEVGAIGADGPEYTDEERGYVDPAPTPFVFVSSMPDPPGPDGEVHQIDNDGNPVWDFDRHTGSVRAVATDPDGYSYTAGGGDHTVRKVGPGGDQQWVFEEHSMAVLDVAVDADGYVYSASLDGSAYKITPGGDVECEFDEHSEAVEAVAVDSSGNFYTGSRDGTVKKSDGSCNQQWTFGGSEYPSNTTVRVLAHNNDGHVYAGASDNSVRRINDGNGSQSGGAFTDHGDDVFGLAVDSSGNVYSGSGDGTVRKISAGSSSQETFFSGHTDTVDGVAVDADGNVYTSGRDTKVFKLDSSGSDQWEYNEFSTGDWLTDVVVAPGRYGAFPGEW